MGNTQTTPENPMRAVVREGFKGALTFKTDEGRPANPTSPEEVLVDVKASAINPVDYKAGKMVMGRIVGLDFAGTVAAVGDGAKHGLKVGDAVFGNAKGCLADQVTAEAKNIAKVPKGLTTVEAASMPTTYLTSLQALRNRGKLKKGGRLLVIGASGGCGTAALQIARSMGAAAIVAVCSGKNANYVKEHGATEVVDYTKNTLGKDVYSGEDESEKFDVVYDCASGSGGGEAYKEASLRILCEDEEKTEQKHGQYVAINGGVGMWARHVTGVKQGANQHLFLTKWNTEDLETLGELVTTGKAKPVIDSCWPFTKEGVEKAFAKLKSRRAVGKIVFDMGLDSANVEEPAKEEPAKE